MVVMAVVELRHKERDEEGGKGGGLHPQTALASASDDWLALARMNETRER